MTETTTARSTQPSGTRTRIVRERPSYGFFALGFLCPVAGLITNLALRRRNPRRSYAAGMGAVVGLVAGFAWVAFKRFVLTML